MKSDETYVQIVKFNFYLHLTFDTKKTIHRSHFFLFFFQTSPRTVLFVSHARHSFSSSFSPLRPECISAMHCNVEKRFERDLIWDLSLFKQRLVNHLQKLYSIKFVEIDGVE